MRLSDFDYHLPEERIAQQPAARRDESRLLQVPRGGGGCQHKRFSDLLHLLVEGDLLVLNDTQVIPARVYGHKQTGGRVELLLDRPLAEADGEGGQEWAVLVRASKPLREGASVFLPEGASALCLGRTPENAYRLKLSFGRPILDYLARHGCIPLPAYIERKPADDERNEQDLERYQTVYAKREGAVAAPTAGLHFTSELLEKLANKGVRLARVTLHVGPGTFLPVRVDEVDDHKMHAERFLISQEASAAIGRAKAESRRVVAVGTTVVRTLEGAWDETIHAPRPGEGLTDIFIRPGFEFRAVDALLTNFHLPKSTLIMLVAAFAGRENVLGAYEEAVAEGYRFYSYGDAMFLA
jgi:S-adenosylmethionine:tRNA ribosyltransferase-isomerase